MKLYVQLNFGGNCDEAFRFYAELLGGEISMMMRQREMPAAGPPGAHPDAVIHARLELRQAGTVLIGNDVPPERFQPVRSSYLYLALDSIADIERVYAALGEGGEVFMPLRKEFFAERFAMLRDRFGVSWSLIHEPMAR